MPAKRQGCSALWLKRHGSSANVQLQKTLVERFTLVERDGIRSRKIAGRVLQKCLSHNCAGFYSASSSESESRAPTIAASEVFFKIFIFLFLDTLSQQIFFLIIKINIFWGDLCSISVKTATLISNCCSLGTSLPGFESSLNARLLCWFYKCIDSSASFFKIKLNIFLDTLIQKIFF